MTGNELLKSLCEAGVVPESIVRLDQTVTHRHVRYVDLLHQGSDSLLPDMVVESGGQPFAYVVRKDRLSDQPHQIASPLALLTRVLACRSDARYLCVVAHGTLDVYPLGIFRGTPTVLTAEGKRPTWRELLSSAAPLQSGASRSKDLWLETLLFSLLVEAAKGIHGAAPQLSIQQVLALVGRSLFFRFLVDRGIVGEGDLDQISSEAKCLEELFGTAPALIDTCRWLDKTFNGDLLSLEHKNYVDVIRQIGPGIQTVCQHLSNIQYRALGGQLELDWRGIMFKHVPVDVLSQVYEDFAHEFVPLLASTTSVHFTPRQIAEIVVEGAFSACSRTDLHNAAVLDPAAGGGVFLVLSFRRLVAEHWKAQGRRPTRKQIRKILNSQLTGFDVNCDALNIAALSLYLAALELDPSPSPLSDLKFDKLIGSVLHPVAPGDSQSLQRTCKDALLGSLSEDVLAYRKGSFDIVVANPPWTGFKGEQASLLNKTVSRLLAGDSSTTQHDDLTAVARYGSPDTAFLLGATEWAKPGGALGFIVHARFLFQEATFTLRQRVFRRVRITGIMNFAALRQDKRLWPTNSAPFALIVGRNEAAKDEESFYFISPRHEPHLAEIGQFRVDPGAATPVPLNALLYPYAFKSIFKGGLLGLKLVGHIHSRCEHSIGEVLAARGLSFNAGFQVGKPDKQLQDARHLQNLPLADVSMAFSVPANAPATPYCKLQWARKPTIFEGPLLLFRESPKLEKKLRGALHCSQSTAYSESFSGLSFSSREQESALLAEVLYVLSYSDLFLYYQLLTSSKFGVERDATLQTDVEKFPLVELENISSSVQQEIRMLGDQLRAGAPDWDRLNNTVADLYDLSGADVQLIVDTLCTELPYAEIKHRASSPPTSHDVSAFLEAFNELVAPFNDSRAAISSASAISVAGWTFFWITNEGSNGRGLAALNEQEVATLTAMASSYWSSQLAVHIEDGVRLVGRLSQHRYWTRTEARLLALDWLQSPSPHSFTLPANTQQ